MKYILIILLLISCNNEVDNHQVTIDSLHNELFIKQTEVGRYEVALEMLKEEDSVAAAKFENILYTKTE